MQIAHIVDKLGYGGAQQVVADLAMRIRQSGHGVRIVCLRDLDGNPERLQKIRDAGVAVTELHKPEGFHLPTLQRLTAYLKAEKIDVVHSHNHLVHHYAAAAGRMAGTKAVVNTLHGTATLVMAARLAAKRREASRHRLRPRRARASTAAPPCACIGAGRRSCQPKHQSLASSRRCSALRPAMSTPALFWRCSASMWRR